MNHHAPASVHADIRSDAIETPPLACTIAILVHNEATNIARCLDSVLDQQTENVVVERIVVVSSGSQDGTNEIVAQFRADHPSLELVIESERRGKIAAWNLLLRKGSAGDILVSIGGDIIAQPGWLEALVDPLHDPRVGMTGGRPVPVDDESSFCGYLANVLWRVHHRVATVSPKLGESIAFRHPGVEIPEWVIVDEAYLECHWLRQGRRLEYVPEAVVSNKGPETVRDFVRQYRRNVAGHLLLKKRFDYAVATLSIRQALRALRPELAASPRRLLRLAAILGLSLYGRLLGHWDSRFRPDRHRIWRIATTTKRLEAALPKPTPAAR